MQNTKNTKVELYLRGDIVEDTSQMTAAKIMDMQCPYCRVAHGQAADAVSAYTQVKMGDAPKFLKNSKNRNVQTFGFVYRDTNVLIHGPVWKTHSFFLSESCMVIHWQDCYGKGDLRKSYCSTVGRRFPIGNAYSYTVTEELFLSVYVDDIKLAGKEQNIDPMWRLLNKEVGLGEPTSFLDHAYAGLRSKTM